MAGEPLVLTRPSQLNATRLGRGRVGAGTTRRESRRLRSRVRGEPETQGAHDLSAETSTVPGRSTVPVRIALTGAIESVPAKAASARAIDAPGHLVDGT